MVGSGSTDVISPAAVAAGLPPLGWHAFRHSYRSWLGEMGTGPEVQKNLMRHSTIAMSLEGYGKGVPAANREATRNWSTHCCSDFRLMNCNCTVTTRN